MVGKDINSIVKNVFCPLPLVTGFFVLKTS